MKTPNESTDQVTIDKVWVGGFPLSKADINSVELVFGIDAESAKNRLKQTAMLQLVFIASSVLLVTISIVLFPAYLFALKNKKWLFSLFPRVGYYSLIGPILVSSFATQFLSDRSIIFTSGMTWIIIVGLCFGLWYVFLQTQEVVMADTVKHTRIGRKLVFLLAMGFSSYFVVGFANRMLDLNKTEKWVTVVMDKEVQDNIEYGTSYVITTSGKGTINSIKSRVQQTAYEQLAIGDSVTHFIKPGLFGSPWVSRELEPNPLGAQ